METRIESLSLSEDQPHWDEVPSNPPLAPTPHDDHRHAAPVSTTSSSGAPQLPPLPDISDLDPFAPPPPPPPPPQKLLGDAVSPSSRLELIDAGDSDGGPSSPTDPEHAAASSEAKPSASGLGGPPQSPGGSGGFLGGMLRSLSGQSTPPLASRSATPSTPPLPPPASSSTSASPFQNLLPSHFRTGSGASPTTPGPEASSSAEKGHIAVSDSSIGTTPESSESEKRAAGPDVPAPTEDEVVFDFNAFLQQMRQRSADPVAKYLRSFLKEFSRRPPLAPSDQMRVINDFLDFIAGKMRAVDPWKSMLQKDTSRSKAEDGGLETRGELEFDMAMEAMEKLVMNRLWHLTFSPAIEATITGGTGNTDDLERDHVLTQRIRLFNWIEPKHLDLPIPSPSQPPTLPTSTSSSSFTEALDAPASATNGDVAPPALTISPSSPTPSSSSAFSSPKKKRRQSSPATKAAKQTASFVSFAQRELAKINDYKAPRDKMICILNCCKVIFGLIRQVAKGDEGADSFIPFLIYIVLRTNPKHLVSNIQYIQRFRNPAKLNGEGGYYLSSLNGAISFIETMDASSLSCITQTEFESAVEAAILALPVDPNDASLRLASTPTKADFPSDVTQTQTQSQHQHQHHGEAPTHSTPSRARAAQHDASESDQPVDDSPRPLDAPALPPPHAQAHKNFLLRGTEGVERIVSKPLSAIGRILDHLDPLPPPPPPISSSSSAAHHHQHHQQQMQMQQGGGGALPTRRSSGASQRDAEAVRRIEDVHDEQRKASLQTLQGVFPQLETEVLEMVLLSNGGDVAQSVERLLEMS